MRTATLKKIVAFLPILAVTLVIAWSMIAAVLEKVGHAAPTLDDAYIHYQYARAFADGHPFRYTPDAPRSSGATSLLWPLILAPFWALGLKGSALTWATYLLGFGALAGLAYESQKLTEKLTSRALGWAAALGTLSFGGLLWSAASGMEVVPFAWMIARSLRLASEWSEAPALDRTPQRFRAIVLATFAMALLRPEGQAYALLVALVVAFFPAQNSIKSRARAMVPAAAALASPMLLLLLTGSAKSSTAEVKLLVGNPYYNVLESTLANARLLVGTLLNGEGWTPEFLPHGVAPIALGGLASTLACGVTKRVPVRGALVLAFGLGMFIPCAYVTFLWNRLRYLWPFAPGFIMGAMCLAYLAGEIAARVRVRFRALSLVLAGCVIGGLATHFNWVREDVAQSASGIDRQQATLGRWAKEHLPANARIGVNDTGAIAYFSERTTFDIVGLTTPSEAHYWVGGTASRFEHYERMHARAPESLPNFFIVYPQWLGCDSILGPMLNEAVVTDANILGGQSMRVHVANWALLGTGEAPWTNVGKLVDVVDVADLESEKEHDYSLEGAHDGEETVLESSAPDGHPVVDGGRTRRSREHFYAKLPPGKDSGAVVRIRGDATTKVEILAHGEKLADMTFADSEWLEAPFRVPAKLASDHTDIELRASDGTVDVFHYYFGSE